MMSNYTVTAPYGVDPVRSNPDRVKVKIQFSNGHTENIFGNATDANLSSIQKGDILEVNRVDKNGKTYWNFVRNVTRGSAPAPSSGPPMPSSPPNDTPALGYPETAFKPSRATNAGHRGATDTASAYVEAYRAIYSDVADSFVSLAMDVPSMQRIASDVFTAMVQSGKI